MIVFANHASFSHGRDQWNPLVESRLCLWCKGGKGTIIVNGERHSLRSGDYFFLPWAFSIRYIPDKKDPFYLAGIHLIPQYDSNTESPQDYYEVSHNEEHPLSGQPSRRDTELPGLEGMIHYHIRADHALMLLSETIVSHFQSPCRNHDQLKDYAKVLIRELSDARNLISVPRKLQNLLTTIDDHLATPLSLADFSEQLQLSTSQVRRLFKQWLQMSPLEYLTHKRIEKAEVLLSTTRNSIEEIASDVGFDDPFYFSRVFKKTRGISPTVHRKQAGFL